MKTLTLTISFLALLDLAITPILLNHIRKTGGFHCLVSTLHKSLFLFLMIIVGYFTMRNSSQNLLFQMVFCGSFLFILNKTLEINEYLFKTLNPKDYSLEGMTEEGKRGMQEVFENMRKQNERTMNQRIVEMNRNFRSNFGYDLSIVYMVVTNDKKMKDELNEIHKTMGNDTAFTDMKMVDMLSMVKNRIQVDACVVVATGLMAIL